MDSNTKIVVLGGGESGTGAAVLAKKKGFSVILSDNNRIDEKYKSVLKHFEVEFEENGHRLPKLLKADLKARTLAYNFIKVQVFRTMFRL